MKITIPEDITADDVRDITVGLSDVIKRAASQNVDIKNAVEFTLTEKSRETLGLYMKSLRAELTQLVEKE